ncbi:MAG: peptidase [Thermoanaerobaculia bacterium]
MKKSAVVLATMILILAVAGCATYTPPYVELPGNANAQLPTVAQDVPQRVAQMPRTVIDYDHSLLDANEQAVVGKLIDAAKVIDEIYWLQVSEKNRQWYEDLASAAKVSPLHAAALDYFGIMKGPWDRLKADEPFLLEAGPKPPGAAFYPPDMTKEEFENWIKAHPSDEAAFRGLFTVIRRKGDGLVAIPYSVYYHDLLTDAANKLREAASMTRNATLADFLNKRADAFLTDDYFASDVAWMDLDSPIEVVIGPYEVYEDGIFNYKASFESFITAVDPQESAKLTVYAKHLPGMEMNLPEPEQYKNPNRGTDSPIRVVQEIYTAGDARSGVMTSAFNLPNDEKVREAKGSKKVLLKNVMEAKYEKSGKPIALLVLDPSQTDLISFDAYFNHTLFHELSHGLGPGIITGPDGKKVEARLLLKELYSTIEECKADVLGVWNILYAMDQGLITSFTPDQLYATNAGLMFRSLRFGLAEAHGRGTAVQWNWYREKGAIEPAGNGRFRVDTSKMKEAVQSLATELLTIEATGDYARAKSLLDKYGVSTPEMEATIARLKGIPVDIAPVFPAAGEK